MTLDVLQRPATSCGGNASLSRSAAPLVCSNGVLMKKTKKKTSTKHTNLAIGIRRSKTAHRDDIPEQRDDSDSDDSDSDDSDSDDNNARATSRSINSTKHTTATVCSKLLRTREATGDRTLQLTNMLRSEEAKLSQQLLIASEKGNKHAAYLLLHQGIDKDRCKGMGGYSPLHYAATRGHLDVLQLLLTFGWHVDSSNDLRETPLHLAAYNGHATVAECLLDRGADVNALNSDNETPLFYAARKSHNRVVRLLIRRECDLMRSNRFGDVAQDEATHEKTQLEFTIGKEDAQRLYTVRPSELKCRGSVPTDQNVPSEQRMSQMQRELILSFLDLKSLCLASQTSYRWHRAADNPSLWRRLGVSRWELLLSATMGLGAMSPMGTVVGGLRLNLTSTSKSSSRRPSSCDQGGSRFAPAAAAAPSIQRKKSSVMQRGGDEQ